MTAIQVLSVFVLIFYFCLYFGLGRADDELYKKFYQTDYKLKVEREMVVYCNRNIVEFNLYMYKYNRTQFATNVTMLFHVDVGNDIEIVVQAFKFLSNEYRTFPLRFQYNVCKGFKYDIGGMQTCINKCGYFACPFKKDTHYHICNCILDESRFPPFLPNGNFKLQLEAEYKNQIIGRSETYLTISRPVLPPKRIG